MPLNLGIDASIGSPGEGSLSGEGDDGMSEGGRTRRGDTTHALSDEMELLLVRSGREAAASSTGPSPQASKTPSAPQGGRGPNAASRSQPSPALASPLRDLTAHGDEAANSKRDARMWEARYQALKSNRESSESDQLAAAQQKAVEMEAGLLQERHRSGMLQAQLSSVTHRRSDADMRMHAGPLLDRIKELDRTCSLLETTVSSISRRGGLARSRGLSPEREKTLLHEQVLQLRQQCVAADALAESRGRLVEQKQQLLESSQEQRRLLLSKMNEIEGARDADSVKISTLKTERTALVEAIEKLQSDATHRVGQGALTLQAVIPAFDSMSDTAGALEKTLQGLRVGVEQCLTDNFLRRTSEAQLNAMLQELQSSYVDAQNVSRDHTVHAMRSDLASMAHELERRERLVGMLEEQLRATHEHAVSVEKDRAALQQRIMLLMCSMDLQESDSVMAKQQLLERALMDTTQQLAHAQQLIAKERSVHDSGSVVDVQILARFDGIEKGVQTLERVGKSSPRYHAASVNAGASHAERESIAALQSKIDQLTEENARLEGDKEILTGALTDAESGLREVKSRSRQRMFSSESDQLWEEVRTLTVQASERTSQTQLLKDEIARLEGVARREQLDNTRKQHRIESLEQQLEDALVRSREVAAAERERSGWLEERESGVQSELLREVAKHKRTLAEMENLASAKEDLERENLRLSKTLSTVKRSLLDLVQGSQSGSRSQASGGAEIRARVFSILGGLSSHVH